MELEESLEEVKLKIEENRKEIISIQKNYDKLLNVEFSKIIDLVDWVSNVRTHNDIISFHIINKAATINVVIASLVNYNRKMRENESPIIFKNIKTQYVLKYHSKEISLSDEFELCVLIITGKLAQSLKNEESEIFMLVKDMTYELHHLKKENDEFDKDKTVITNLIREKKLDEIKSNIQIGNTFICSNPNENKHLPKKLKFTIEKIVDNTIFLNQGENNHNLYFDHLVTYIYDNNMVLDRKSKIKNFLEE